MPSWLLFAVTNVSWKHCGKQGSIPFAVVGKAWQNSWPLEDLARLFTLVDQGTEEEARMEPIYNPDRPAQVTCLHQSVLIAPVHGDQAFKHTSCGGMVHIQTTRSKAIFSCQCPQASLPLTGMHPYEANSKKPAAPA